MLKLCDAIKISHPKPHGPFIQIGNSRNIGQIRAMTKQQVVGIVGRNARRVGHGGSTLSVRVITRSGDDAASGDSRATVLQGSLSIMVHDTTREL